MKKCIVAIILLISVISFTGCNETENVAENVLEVIPSESILPWERWDYEIIPEGKIKFINIVDRSSVFRAIAGGSVEEWRFEAIEPGEVTLCWLKSDDYIDQFDSFAQDYIIADDLSITAIGEPYSVFDVEGCTAFEQFLDHIVYRLSEKLNSNKNEYKGTSYRVTYDLDKKEIYVKAKEKPYYNNDDIEVYVHKISQEYLDIMGGILDEFSVEVTFI
jgi:hypothetical protein